MVTNKNLWLDHLPNNTQVILAASKDDLSQLALLADKIAEVVQNHSIAAVTCTSTNNDRDAGTSETIARLERQVRDLSIKLDKLFTQRSRTKKRNFSSSPSRSKSGYRSARDSSNTRNMCWYHRTFAERATKCRSPCTFN